MDSSDSVLGISGAMRDAFMLIGNIPAQTPPMFVWKKTGGRPSGPGAFVVAISKKDSLNFWFTKLPY